MTFIWVARIWIWIKMRMVPEPQLANHRQCSSCSGLWHVHTDFIRLSIQRSVWSFKCLVLYKEARMYCRHRRTAIRCHQYPGQTSKPWSTWPGLAWTSLNSEPLKLYSEGYEYEKKTGTTWRLGASTPVLMVVLQEYMPCWRCREHFTQQPALSARFVTAFFCADPSRGDLNRFVVLYLPFQCKPVEVARRRWDSAADEVSTPRAGSGRTTPWESPRARSIWQLKVEGDVEQKDQKQMSGSERKLPNAPVMLSRSTSVFFAPKGLFFKLNTCSAVKFQGEAFLTKNIACLLQWSNCRRIVKDSLKIQVYIRDHLVITWTTAKPKKLGPCIWVCPKMGYPNILWSINVCGLFSQFTLPCSGGINLHFQAKPCPWHVWAASVLCRTIASGIHCMSHFGCSRISTCWNPSKPWKPLVTTSDLASRIVLIAEFHLLYAKELMTSRLACLRTRLLKLSTAS